LEVVEMLWEVYFTLGLPGCCLRDKNPHERARPIGSSPPHEEGEGYDRQEGNWGGRTYREKIHS